LITDKGQIYAKNNRNPLIDFDMKNPIAFDVSKNMMAITDANGSIKLLHPLPIFDNIIRAKAQTDKKETNSQISPFQKKKVSSSSEQSEAKESMTSPMPTQPKTYSQYLKDQGKSINFGIRRGTKLKDYQSFANE
jgi:hypothetical protein